MVFRKNLRSLERRWEKNSKFLGDLPSEQIFYRNIPLGAPVPRLCHSTRELVVILRLPGTCLAAFLWAPCNVKVQNCVAVQLRKRPKTAYFLRRREPANGTKRETQDQFSIRLENLIIHARRALHDSRLPRPRFRSK